VRTSPVGAAQLQGGITATSVFPQFQLWGGAACRALSARAVESTGL